MKFRAGDRFPIERIEMQYSRGRIDDWVNYWALVNGDQIIVCRRHLSGDYLLVWPKKSERSNYHWEYSQYGKAYLKSQPRFVESCFLAHVEYVPIRGTHRDIWDKLSAEKEFCMWEPEEPYRYFAKGRNPHYLAFYRVYRTTLRVLRGDVRQRGQLYVEIINKDILDQLGKVTRTPIISEDEFEKRKEKILSIAQKKCL